MPIFFNVDYNGVAVLGQRAGVSRKVRDAAIRFAMTHVAEYWHEHIWQRHFDRGAKRKYRHKKRKRGYSKIKRDKAAGIPYRNPRTGKIEHEHVVKGGVVDIAYEGHTQTKGRRNRAIRANRNGFVMKLLVPKYITQRRRGSYPDMKRELTTTTVAESIELRRQFWIAYKMFLDANKVVQTFRTR